MIVLCKCLLQSRWVNFKINYNVMHPSTGCRGKCIMFTLSGAPKKILNSSLTIGQATVTVCLPRAIACLDWSFVNRTSELWKGLAWQRNQLVLFSTFFLNSVWSALWFTVMITYFFNCMFCFVMQVRTTPTPASYIHHPTRKMCITAGCSMLAEHYSLYCSPDCVQK